MLTHGGFLQEQIGGVAWPDPWIGRMRKARTIKGLVTLASTTCASTTIVA